MECIKNLLSFLKVVNDLIKAKIDEIIIKNEKNISPSNIVHSSWQMILYEQSMLYIFLEKQRKLIFGSLQKNLILLQNQIINKYKILTNETIYDYLLIYM